MRFEDYNYNNYN